ETKNIFGSIFTFDDIERNEEEKGLVEDDGPTVVTGGPVASMATLPFVPKVQIPPFQLKIVQLGSCKISDKFPEWLQTQRDLEVLVLSNASISGPLPTWLMQLPIIDVLDLSENKLTGPLTNLASGARFERDRYPFTGMLNLQNNMFTGSIPRSLCTWIDLEVLDLSRNRLTGKAPKCLKNLGNLR
nr:putative leucine-rich repeat protein, plant-type [Tanacetum cinerariifolium]